MPFTEFHCQTTGSNLNAGSTTADAASLTYASGTWVAATGVFTVASGDPVTDGVAVGDFASVYADGATVGVFVGRVTARDATTITVSLTAKAGTAPTDGTNTRTLKIGGAWDGPNGAVGFPFNFVQSTLTNVAGDFPRVNFKNGVNYDITAAMTHGNAGPIVWQGYTTAVGDGGLAQFDGGTNAIVLLSVSGANNVLDSLIFANNGTTGANDGLSVSVSDCILRRIVAHDIRGSGISVTGTSWNAMIECEAYACNQANGTGDAGIISTGVQILIRCISHHNTGSNNDGFQFPSANSIDCFGCIAHGNGRDGFGSAVVTRTSLVACDSYDNGRDGARLANTSAAAYYLENCNFLKNGGYGVNGSGAGARNGGMVNCRFGAGTQANTSGASTGLSGIAEIGTANYAADVTPWVDAADGDFRISLAAAKGAGRGSFVQTQSGYGDPNASVAYPDIGAVQHQDAGGGGGGGLKLVGSGGLVG